MQSKNPDAPRKTLLSSSAWHISFPNAPDVCVDEAVELAELTTVVLYVVVAVDDGLAQSAEDLSYLDAT